MSIDPNVERFLEAYASGAGGDAAADLVRACRASPSAPSASAVASAPIPLTAAAADFADALILGSKTSLLLVIQRLKPLLASYAGGAKSACAHRLAFDERLLQYALVPQAQFESIRAKNARLPEGAFVEWMRCERQIEPLDDDIAANVLRQLRPPHATTVRAQLELHRGIAALRDAKPELVAALGPVVVPYLPHTPPQPLRAHAIDAELNATEGAPLVLLADSLGPLARERLDTLRARCSSLVLVFRDTLRLAIAMADPRVRALACAPDIGVLVLSRYPNAQLRSQSPAAFAWDPGARIDVPLAAAYSRDVATALVRLLGECGRQPRAVLVGDTDVATSLYRLASRHAFELRAEELGPDRFVPHYVSHFTASWADPHKSTAPRDRDEGPDPAMRLRAYVEQVPSSPAGSAADAPRSEGVAIAASKPAEASRLSAPLKMAHVVPAIVDGGHAPTRLLRTLVRHADRASLSLAVLSTELYARHVGDYPPVEFESANSSRRAPETFRWLSDLGVPARCLERDASRLGAVQSALDWLAKGRFDVVVFHAPDPVNLLIARQMSASCRVFFSHGLAPPTNDFELVVLESEAAKTQFERESHARVAAAALPYVVDARESWDASPLPRAALRVPPGAQVLTTISNHLEARVGDAMARAIARILDRVPGAYWAPIGPVADASGFLARLATHGVPPRVRLLGPVASPSHVARSCDVYLNEFPFGGGLAILDAMAAGLPVVSMYDARDNAPPQARFGGDYFGAERCVDAGDEDAYVERACELLERPDLRSEWSAHATREYERRTDTDRYVRAFESLCRDALARDSGADARESSSQRG